MVLVNSRLVMEISDVARSEAETEPSGDFVATPSGVRTSLDDPEIKANPVGLSVTSHPLGGCGCLCQGECLPLLFKLHEI